MKSFLKHIVVTILTWEATILLNRHRPTVIGITGNVGKTTTKDAIYAAIKNSVVARKSEKSFNSEIGVPVTVLGLKNGWNNPLLWAKNIIDGFFLAFFSKEYPKVLILEMGIDRPGDMERMTRWVKPDIAVITRLPEVPVHVEYFSSPEAVVEEKMKLVTALKTDGVFVYNHDDEIVRRQVAAVRQRTVGFSRYVPSDFTGGDDKTVYHDDMPHGVAFTVKHTEQSATVTLLGTVGTHHVYACTAALAVADVLGVPLAEAAVGLQELTTSNGRMRLILGIKSTMIIDDTYNSSPVACEEALSALREIRYARRKIAVIGDMLELGRFSSAAHERIGSIVPSAATMLVTVGVRARKIAEAALVAGMPEENILQYEDVERAGRELQNLIQAGDVLLVKASQGIRAEKIVEELMAHPEQAGSLLVRQDIEWSKR